MFLMDLYTNSNIGFTRQINYSAPGTDGGVAYAGCFVPGGTNVNNSEYSGDLTNVSPLIPFTINNSEELKYPMLFGVQATTPIRFRQRRIHQALQAVDESDPAVVNGTIFPFRDLSGGGGSVGVWKNIKTSGQMQYWKGSGSNQPDPNTYPWSTVSTTPPITNVYSFDVVGAFDLGMPLQPNVLYPVTVSGKVDSWFSFFVRNADNTASTAGVFSLTYLGNPRAVADLVP